MKPLDFEVDREIMHGFMVRNIEQSSQGLSHYTFYGARAAVSAQMLRQNTAGMLDEVIEDIEDDSLRSYFINVESALLKCSDALGKWSSKYTLGCHDDMELLNEHFEQLRSLAALYNKGIELYKDVPEGDMKDEFRHLLDNLGNKIRKANDMFSRHECFIATAVYGSAEAPQVRELREFRDNVLNKTGIGRKAVDLYYSGCGKKAAETIKDFPGCLPVIKTGLDNIVKCYKRKYASGSNEN